MTMTMTTMMMMMMMMMMIGFWYFLRTAFRVNGAVVDQIQRRQMVGHDHAPNPSDSTMGWNVC
eukprot:5992567-Amphidinium_carterae.1